PPPTTTLFPYTTLFRSHEEDHRGKPHHPVPHRGPRVMRMWVRPVRSVAVPPRHPERHEDQAQHHEEEDDADPVRESPEEREAERSEEHTSELQSRFDLV